MGINCACYLGKYKVTGEKTEILTLVVAICAEDVIVQKMVDDFFNPKLTGSIPQKECNRLEQLLRELGMSVSGSYRVVINDIPPTMLIGSHNKFKLINNKGYYFEGIISKENLQLYGFNRLEDIESAKSFKVVFASEFNLNNLRVGNINQTNMLRPRIEKQVGR
ncbi:hypothetical protein [Oceanobacillus picturae]|uniref:hypothetical protein n=1 Tax=Oceanobacillus picturae TaxID=171693 RepID=UPI0036320B7F